MIRFTPLLLVAFISVHNLYSQQLTQTVRGTVIDKISKTGLPGASVVIQNSDPLVGVTTDADGNFRMAQIPVGTHTFRISFVGYKDVTISRTKQFLVSIVKI